MENEYSWYVGGEYKICRPCKEKTGSKGIKRFMKKMHEKRFLEIARVETETYFPNCESQNFKKFKTISSFTKRSGNARHF